MSNSLSALQSKIANAQQQEARIQVAREVAKQRLDEAVTSLKEEFGVDSAEEALSLAKKLDAELVSEVQQIEALLEEDDA